MKPKQLYKVIVRTTDSFTQGTFVDNQDYSGPYIDRNYYDCENGVCYVSTNNPSLIYSEFSRDTVISIQRIGLCYELGETNEN